MEDSGIFAAVAENRGGGAKCSANLVVEERRQGRDGLVPPSFLTTIEDAAVKAGQLVRFDAKVLENIRNRLIEKSRKLTGNNIHFIPFHHFSFVLVYLHLMY